MKCIKCLSVVMLFLASTAIAGDFDSPGEHQAVGILVIFSTERAVLDIGNYCTSLSPTHSELRDAAVSHWNKANNRFIVLGGRLLIEIEANALARDKKEEHAAFIKLLPELLMSGSRALVGRASSLPTESEKNDFCRAALTDIRDGKLDIASGDVAEPEVQQYLIRRVSEKPAGI